MDNINKEIFFKEYDNYKRSILKRLNEDLDIIIKADNQATTSLNRTLTTKLPARDNAVLRYNSTLESLNTVESAEMILKEWR